MERKSWFVYIARDGEDLALANNSNCAISLAGDTGS